MHTPLQWWDTKVRGKKHGLHYAHNNISLTLTHPCLACFDENIQYLLVCVFHKGQSSSCLFSHKVSVFPNHTAQCSSFSLLILQCPCLYWSKQQLQSSRLGAFYNNTCMMAGHVTEQDQWGRSKMCGIKGGGGYICGGLFLWFSAVDEVHLPLTQVKIIIQQCKKCSLQVKVLH